jgi:hypothetical protein
LKYSSPSDPLVGSEGRLTSFKPVKNFFAIFFLLI